MTRGNAAAHINERVCAQCTLAIIAAPTAGYTIAIDVVEKVVLSVEAVEFARRLEITIVTRFVKQLDRRFICQFKLTNFLPSSIFVSFQTRFWVGPHSLPHCKCVRGTLSETLCFFVHAYLVGREYGLLFLALLLATGGLWAYSS